MKIYRLHVKCICVWIMQEIRSRTLIDPVMKHYEWVIVIFIFFFRIMRTTTSIEGKNEPRPPQFIQNQAVLFCTSTAFKESSFYVACWFLFMAFRINQIQTITKPITNGKCQIFFYLLGNVIVLSTWVRTTHIIDWCVFVSKYWCIWCPVCTKLYEKAWILI